MNYHTLTDWPALWQIAQERQIAKPQECRVMCGGCGVELSAEGLIHWPDCENPGRVLFLQQDMITGNWEEVGNPSSGPFPDAGPIAFAG
jgi:hypothetical protein